MSLVSLKKLNDSKRKMNNPEFKNRIKSVINTCLNEKDKKRNLKIPVHFKDMDAVTKHSKIFHHKGVLPSGHRGDLVKIRNGHGTLAFFPSS